jgi:uncharacterized protein
VNLIAIILSGFTVGVSLGLTGGGGSLLAIPLLVYAVGQSPHMALGTSLASVGATAFSGAVRRMMEGRVEVRAGLLFAVLGSVGTYIGTRMNARVPGSVLLILLAGLTVLLAVRMWCRASREKNSCVVGERNEEKRFQPIPLVATAIGCGFASGFFGIGGGFIVVPALVLVVGLSMDAAVATSLLVISFNGAVGVISYAAQGRAIDYSVAGIFVAGGLAGMWVGQKTGNHLNERMLSRLFAAVLLLVAMFLIYKNI